MWLHIHRACRATGTGSLKTTIPSRLSWPAEKRIHRGIGPALSRPQFHGHDLKGNRIYIGAKTCLAEGLTNAAFVRSHIDKITDISLRAKYRKMAHLPRSAMRISRAKKRITHPKFLRLYTNTGARRYYSFKNRFARTVPVTKRVIELYGLTLLEIPISIRRRNHFAGIVYQNPL